MPVLNIHTRRLDATEDEVGALLDTLAGDDDRLWPHDRWPAMRFDRPLQVGATGGHGPVRYRVEEYQPGRRIRFRFTGGPGFDGFHELAITTEDDGTVLRHLLAARPRGTSRLTWMLFYRWMHDALVEDALDRAERTLTGTARTPAHWNPYVRLLRTLGGPILRRAEPIADRKAPQQVS